jgi:dimethylhistidine N-methyltransferase
MNPDDDVFAGLRASPKALPARLFYDARGAALFEQITGVEDYYLTRSELALLEASLPRVAARVGPHARVIEPGSGAGRKTRMLLGALGRPATYVPIDVADGQLAETAAALRRDFASLEVLPVLGDYTQPLTVPASLRRVDRSLVFFPGSTIGNFEPGEAARFLARLGQLAGPGAMLLLGADGNTHREELLRAYDDSEGVTAAFNLNVLVHLNARLGANFDVGQFVHRAVWNEAHSRVEMHLVSQREQTVALQGVQVVFGRGEPVVTEHCYKHTPAALEGLLREGGWTVDETFVDPAQRMRLWLARRG